jgi:O-antigen/teichoic acid export membrane protein
METENESSNLRQKAAKGIAWSAIQSWGRQAIAFTIFFVLARLLGPESFGLVASAWIFLAFVEVFLDQGFSTVIIQRYELEPQHLDTAFWTNLSVGFSMTVLCVATADLVASIFKQPTLAPIIRCLSLIMLINSASNVQEAIFRRKLEFQPLVIRELVSVSVGGIVGITMAIMGFGVWSLVGQQLANSLVQVILLWKASDWRPGLNVSRKHFQEMFSFGINVVGIKIINFFSRSSDNFLISYYLGPVALGYYNIAYRLFITVLMLLTGVTSQVILPSFARLQQEPEKLRQVFYDVTQLTSLVSIPVFVGMAVLAPELVEVLFGRQWLPSIPVIEILAFIGILESAYFYYTDVMMAIGKPLQRLGIDVLNLIANIIGFAIAIRWGIVAVAGAFVIRGYLLAPLSLLLLKKVINIKISRYLNLFITPISASLVMTITIFFSKQILMRNTPLPISLGISILFGTAAYATTIILIAPKFFRQVMSFVNILIAKNQT